MAIDTAPSYIRRRIISRSEMLSLLAEKASERNQAALKLRRIRAPSAASSNAGSPGSGKGEPMEDNHILKIDPSDDQFGAVLNCAVRYACGRRTYMPALVIGYITPLLPSLSDKTLWCFDKDLTETKYTYGYGDPEIDEPGWKRFHEAVRAERARRGHALYKTWRAEDGN